MSEETTNPTDEDASVPIVDEGVDGADTGVETEGDDLDDGDEPEAGGEPEEDDSEEIDHDGKKYKIPKAIKPLLLMQADYTKKTQSVAEKAKALESREAEITLRAEASKALIAEHAKLHGLQADLAAYDAFSKEQWDELKARDIDKYRDLKDEHRDLKEEVARVSGDLDAKVKESLSAAERASQDAIATQRREMAEVLTGVRKIDGQPDISIPGLNAARLNEISTFATSTYGVTAEELGQITDPRILRALHDAEIGRQLQARDKAAKKVTANQKVTPAKELGSSAPNARKTTDASGDGLSDEEWTRRERERVSKMRHRA